MNMDLIEKINKINKDILKCNVSLKNYNTMKLEAKVKYLILPSSFMELKKVLFVLKEEKVNHTIIGNGSNIIFTSKEKECIIKLNFNSPVYDDIMYSNELLMVKAREFCDKGYKGLEYIGNIPASVGGAIIMNAGAYSHFFSDIIEFVYYLDEELNFKIMEKEKCNFTYRNSFFKGSNKIILGCKIRLIEEDKDVLKKIREECAIKRKITQPVEFPNSGSIFKNQENISAWKLIEGASLKGYKRNGAMISDKHCNFIINFDNAKNEDVIFLINLMKSEVKKHFDVDIEEEVIIID